MIFHGSTWQHLFLNVLAGFQVVTSGYVSEEYSCYHWLIGRSYENNNTVITYSLWIVNPRYASAEEGLRDAESPSEFSKLLTEQFYWLGQRPSVQLAAEKDREDFLPTFVYDNTSSVWKVTFEALVLYRYMGQNLLISGSDICLYECAVGNTMQLIKLTLPIQYDIGQVQATNGAERVGLITEPCDRKTMLLFTSNGVFVSQNSMLSAEKFALKEFESGSVMITDAVILLMKNESFTHHRWHNFISQHMIVFMNNSIIDIASDDFGTKPLRSKILDRKKFSNMNSVTASLWLCNVYSDDRKQMPIAFWNDSALVLTTINFTEATPYRIPVSGILNDVKFTGHRTTLSMLVFNSDTKTLTVLRQNRDVSLPFEELCSWSTNIGSDKYRLTVAPVGLTVLYAWNDMVIYYYFGPGNFGKLTIFGSDDEIGASDNAIKQLVITRRSEVAISLKNGSLFYSKVMHKQVWKVRMSIDRDSILFADEIGRFFTVTQPNLTRTPLDLSYRTVAWENTSLKCPFDDFQISGQDRLNTFVIDIGEEVRIRSLLFLPGGIDEDTIKVDFEKLDVIKTEVTSEAHMEEGGVSQLKEISFSIIPEKTIHVSHGNTYMGHAGFQLEPVRNDPGRIVCPLPHLMTGYIYVGCAFTKRLQIRREKNPFREGDEECEMFKGKPSAPYKYTLRSKQISYPNESYGTSDKTVIYDYDSLGCPIFVHYTLTLFPEIVLVDRKTKKENPVNVDFVVFERNNRLFGYNSSALDIKCSSIPQTWKSISKSTNETDMEYMWTPANYKSCHAPGNDSVSRRNMPADSYQVLNGSNVNGLTFLHDGSLGIYIFTVVVVDPKLSFCHLSATFSVHVYGKVVRRDFLSLYITLGIYSVLLISFVLAMYFYFRDHVYGK